MAFKDSANNPDGQAEVSLRVVANTAGNAELGMYERQLTTNGSKRALINKLDYMEPKSTVAMLYHDVIGESPSSVDVLNMVQDINETTPLEDVLDVVVTYAMKDKLEFMSDIIGAHKAIFGVDHPTLDAFEEDFSEYENMIGNTREARLRAYISDKLTSNLYLQKYGEIQDMTSEREGDSLEVRDRFVSLHFVNKYGRDPTTSQRLRGAKIVWQNLQASAAANPSLDAATSFIIGLVTEPTTIVGRNTLQFLPGMERHETIYSNQAKLNVITRVVDQSRTSQNILSESNYQQSLRRIISETSFRQKFNLLWSASSTVDDFGFWKNEAWFGHFMDYNFPWIFHENFGWLYSSGTSQNNIWFYSDSLGWFWTNQDIFKDHPNLTSDKQRFVFRVKPGTNGYWEGSWSLLTLQNPNDSTENIIIYDYGYFPL